MDLARHMQMSSQPMNAAFMDNYPGIQYKVEGNAIVYVIPSSYDLDTVQVQLQKMIGQLPGAMGMGVSRDGRTVRIQFHQLELPEGEMCDVNRSSTVSEPPLADRCIDQHVPIACHTTYKQSIERDCEAKIKLALKKGIAIAINKASAKKKKPVIDEVLRLYLTQACNLLKAIDDCLGTGKTQKDIQQHIFQASHDQSTECERPILGIVRWAAGSNYHIQSFVHAMIEEVKRWQVMMVDIKRLLDRAEHMVKVKFKEKQKKKLHVYGIQKVLLDAVMGSTTEVRALEKYYLALYKMVKQGLDDLSDNQITFEQVKREISYDLTYELRSKEMGGASTLRLLGTLIQKQRDLLDYECMFSMLTVCVNDRLC